MTRIVLILTVLALSVSALATVTITAEIDDSNNHKIWIGYSSDEAERIRSFALDIMAEDGNIIAVEDYAIGDDNAGYGIFPGSFGAVPIEVNAVTGEVESWAKSGYTPVTPEGAPEALGGIGTSGITVEFAALYDTAAPSHTEGILCSITVDHDVTEVCVNANARRNNVLLESGAEVQTLILPDTPDETCLKVGQADCFPNGPGYEFEYEQWVRLGKPDCWCEPYQCDGDANGDTQVIGWRVYTNDLQRVADSWKKKIGEAGLDPCADFTHDTQVVGWRVYTDDLGRLVYNWQKKDTQLPGDCPRPR